VQLQASLSGMSVDKIFEALLDAPRRRILASLSKSDMTAAENGPRFADMMSQPAISKQQSIVPTIVEDAGLVRRAKSAA